MDVLPIHLLNVRMVLVQQPPICVYYPMGAAPTNLSVVLLVLVMVLVKQQQHPVQPRFTSVLLVVPMVHVQQLHLLVPTLSIHAHPLLLIDVPVVPARNILQDHPLTLSLWAVHAP